MHERLCGSDRRLDILPAVPLMVSTATEMSLFVSSLGRKSKENA